MAFPLKKTLHATAVSVSLILLVLLGLGIRQYQLYRNHVEVSQQTEKLIFQFSIIREHVTENLLDGQYAGLAPVGAELEELNRNLASVIGNRLIDDHYKLTLANAIDLPGLVLLVRKISGGPVRPEHLRQLNTDIRTLGERLMLFDRVLVEHGKRELISFQNVVIGALAMVVSLIIVLLLFFQRRLIAPLLDLVQQVKEVAAGSRPGLSIAGRSGEISELAYSFHDLLMARQEEIGDREMNLRLEMIASLAGGVSHEVSDLANGLINYAQVLADEEQLKSPGEPENELVAKIIEAGERIAEIVRKFILYGQEEGAATGEFLPVTAVLEDALLLIGYHLKSEGIGLETDLEPAPPVVPVHAQHMQQVFLIILGTIRAGLAERFVGRDPRKKIAIGTQTLVENGQGPLFEVSIKDLGAVIPQDSLSGPGHGEGASLRGWVRMVADCRRIVADHGGLLAISGEEGRYTRIRFTFPLKGD